MRILGMSQEWPKLERPRWTTFRMCRRDRDWEVGEVVQVVLKPRSKSRKELGKAVILGKMTLYAKQLREPEAIADGFSSVEEMLGWLIAAHGAGRVFGEPINKLTLEWVVVDDPTASITV